MLLLLELHHSRCSLRWPCSAHCCKWISRSWHANARILRWWRPLNHVRLLLRLLLLLRPLLLSLLLLLLLKQLSLLEEPTLKLSLTHLLPLQLLL